jgi:hypothetical protein
MPLFGLIAGIFPSPAKALTGNAGWLLRRAISIDVVDAFINLFIGFDAMLFKALAQENSGERI